MNTHINNINGDDLLVIMIFHNEIEIQDCVQKGIKEKDLLIPPQIVGKEYWTRGYFYNIGRFEGIMNVNNYGFYRIGKGKFVDEYGNVLDYEPELLGCFGVVGVRIGWSISINTKNLEVAGVVREELPKFPYWIVYHWT